MCTDSPNTWTPEKKTHIVFLICIALCVKTIVSAQVGKVGINTTTPAAMLHVKDSSVVFTGLNALPATPGNPPVSGPGTRMMWYPDKAAFRVGRVYDVANGWDKDSIGLCSFASGIDTKAKGIYSTAFGSSTTASGIQSTAMGASTTASGTASIAMGAFAVASGGESTSIGTFTLASGQYSTAMGQYTTASGTSAFAIGDNTIASGLTSMTTGEFTNAIGHYSTAAGDHTVATDHASFIVGSYNDTINDAANYRLFAVGNGDIFSRSNALTVLESGDVGIGTSKPAHRLHVSTNHSGEGGWSEGFMVESTNANTGEAAISFKNKAMPATKQWMAGLNQNPSLAFNYGTAFSGGSTRMVLDTLGNIGIGTTSPLAKLHLSKGTGGGMYNSASAMIMEDNADQYIQFSNLNNGNCGLFSGNTLTDIRSAISFLADSSITFKAGGNSTKLTLENNGNLGIGSTVPAQKLHVVGNGYFTGNVGIGNASPTFKLDVTGTTRLNGTAQLGANGTTLTEIIKVSVIKDVANVPANSSVTENFTVANSALASSVYISPESGFADGLVIAYARVFPAGTVEVKFTNTTGSAINPGNMNYYISIIR